MIFVPIFPKNRHGKHKKKPSQKWISRSVRRHWKRMKEIGLFNVWRLTRRRFNKHVAMTGGVVEYVDTLTANCFDDQIKDMWQASEMLPLSELQIDITEAQFLTSLIHIAKAKSVLEIGGFHGWSAAIFAQALVKAEAKAPFVQSQHMVTTIEINPEQIEQAKKLWDTYLDPITRSRINAIQGNALTVLPELAAKQQQFDIVFIDADKSKYRALLDASIDLIPQGGLVVLDNMLNAGLVATASQDRTSQAVRVLNAALFSQADYMEKFEPVIIPAWDGLVILRKL